MNEKLSSNNIPNKEPIFNSEESDYNTLITRLKEISSTITLLEKQYLDRL